MRIGSFHFLTLLSASLTVASGCSDLTAGDAQPPKGPPHLVRLTVQDRSYTGAGRASVVDLLDHAQRAKCAEDDPCITQYLISQTAPDLTCAPDGMCPDALAVPATGVPLNADANTIRVVFDKPLSDNIETINVDQYGAQVPKQTNSLNPGVVELLDGDKNAVPFTAFWDPTGSPTFTSDLVLVPYGPAIVINPASLQAHTTYTVRLHPNTMVDKFNGSHPILWDGTQLADPTDYTFTTEDVQLQSTTPGPADPTMGPSVIAPNDIVQYNFWADVDPKTITAVMFTGPAAFDPTKVEAYTDQGADPTMCSKMADPTTTVDFVYTSAAGTPADWPAGDYSLAFSVGATVLDPLKFTVGGADGDDMMDPNTFGNHVLPEQCAQ